VKRALVTTVLALALTTQPTVGQSADRPTDEMHHFQNSFLAVLREKDTAKFLSYIGTGGVAFGIDAKFQTRREIANEFRSKSGAYRFLFDSTCEGATPPHRGQRATRFCSVYELLTLAKDTKVETGLGSHQGKPPKYVRITPRVLSCSNGSEPVEFIFTQFKDGWRLVAIPFS
jgi:hypothetical protein